MALWCALNEPAFAVDCVRSIVVADGDKKGYHPGGPTMGRFDIIERKDAYDLVTDAPGFNPPDITIELKEGILTISGKHDEPPFEEQDPEAKVWLKERPPHHFSRSFRLPDNARPEDISASLDKGVLTVKVPKLPPAPKPEPRRITVQLRPAVAA